MTTSRSDAPLTPEHPAWDRFCAELYAQLGCAVPGGCKGDHRDAVALLDEFGFHRSTTLAYFENNGGYCDCEVLLNVEDSARARKRDAQTTTPDNSAFTVTIALCGTGETFIATSDDPDYWAIIDTPDAGLAKVLTPYQEQWIHDGNIRRSFWQPRVLVEARGIVDERTYATPRIPVA